MMVKDIVKEYYRFTEEHMKEIAPVLDQMLEANEITVGARYYVYGIFENYHYKELQVLIDKAHAKLNRDTYKGSYSQAFNDVANSWTWNYHLDELKKFDQQCRDLIESERVTCPDCGNVHSVASPCPICLAKQQAENKMVQMPGTEGNWGEKHWGKEEGEE